MSQKDASGGVSEAAIAVHWQEEDKINPSDEFVAQANMTDVDIYNRFSLDNFPDYWVEYAEMLDWEKKWDTVLDAGDAPLYKWFVGGKLNASYNCIDRHLEKYQNKAALIYVPEPEEDNHQVITYRELWVRVNEMAALLRDFAGVKQGDRITIHMPMVPELPITMLACARLGAVHSVVFGGFSGQAAGDRIADSQSKVLITMDAYYRNGRLLDHKIKADEAAEAAALEGMDLEKVLVWQRFPGKNSSETPMVDGRDFFVNDQLKNYWGAKIEPASVSSEDPLFLMYTSGTTGKPKGVQHGTGGYLAYATATASFVQDIHPEDVYWCQADIGWITGHSYIVYGPLALAATSVMYEGVPTFPDAGRTWRIAQQLNVNIFHTAPTTVRMMRKAGPDEPAKYNYHFKLMTTVGEPIEPEVWKWYYEVVGKNEAAIVDTYWQTETGGFMFTTMPALQGMKPGSAGPAMPGIHPIIYDEDGNEIEPGSGTAGNLCVRNPWPGMLQTVWGDRDRFIATYFAKYNTNPNSKDWRDWPYFPGDAAVQSPDGYFRILGRVDDVINVAGHRLGTKEIESACLLVKEVAEAAVVPVNDEVKGKVPDIYISLKPGYDADESIKASVTKAIATEIGPIAKPKNIYIVPDMPKTRSGKIMRRVLSSISNHSDIGDVTTLADPEVVEEVRRLVQDV